MYRFPVTVSYWSTVAYSNQALLHFFTLVKGNSSNFALAPKMCIVGYHVALNALCVALCLAVSAG